jgi:hypothetical protein
MLSSVSATPGEFFDVLNSSGTRTGVLIVPNLLDSVRMSRRENTTLRAQLDPNLVSVIPNAIVPSDFQPRPDQADPEWSKPLLFLFVLFISCVSNRSKGLLGLTRYHLHCERQSRS